MGVINDKKELLAEKTASAAKKAGDGIASLSSLSPKQLREIDEKRSAYLRETPDMNGDEIQGIIQKNLGAIGIEVYQAYLDRLTALLHSFSKKEHPRK